jgi:putative SOS response-associated peptidase YedK
MCVRYTLHDLDNALGAISRALMKALAGPAWAGARYNVGVAQVAPIVADPGTGAEVRLMTWGLALAGAPRMLPNAQSETARDKPSFRRAAAARRCLVPVNGFYEWKHAGRLRLPHLFTLRDEPGFALAGIWDPPGEGRPETFAVLTTEPNALVAPIHHRMPVILPGTAMPRWLAPGPLADAEYRALTHPLDPSLMEVREVNRRVNNVRNDDAGCLGPPDPREPELF